MYSIVLDSFGPDFNNLCASWFVAFCSSETSTTFFTDYQHLSANCWIVVSSLVATMQAHNLVHACTLRSVSILTQVMCTQGHLETTALILKSWFEVPL